ncbi:MAG: clan AA aspartic protease [Verrucomicrobia bacterium]|nr:clan AA aspartic protease [Verrucomicrobiota bacterium]
MGEIAVRVELENFVDRALQEEGRLQEDKVRRHSMDAVADTGAVMLALPQDVVEKLGLRSRRRVVVSYADDRRDERPVAGAVTIKIGDRAMTTECIVRPPLSEALIGQVVMEELDLIADPQRQTLTPRPESPIYPSLKLKRAGAAKIRRRLAARGSD